MPNDYQDQFTSETSEYNQESEQRPISEHRLLKKGDDVRRKVGENIGGNIEDAKGKFEESKHPRDNDGKFTTGNSKNTKSSIFQQPQDITNLVGEEIKGVQGRAAVNALVEKKGGYIKNAFSEKK